LITLQLQVLQEHQAALLTLQQKAQDQLKEARAAQVNIVTTVSFYVIQVLAVFLCTLILFPSIEQSLVYALVRVLATVNDRAALALVE
jgi:hypothetical protein